MTYMEELQQDWPNIAAAIREHTTQLAQPRNQVKMECLNLAAGICIGTANDPLELAKKFHKWITEEETA